MAKTEITKETRSVPSAKPLAHALPPGYLLENYHIKQVLGSGGFGITYLADEVKTNHKLVIKEFFPEYLAERGSDLLLYSRFNGSEHDFEWGLAQFINEARVLSAFNHLNIVKIFDFFKSNNTGYIIMEYIRGRSFAEALAAGDTATEEELLLLVPQLLDALEAIHAVNFYHLDIKPKNIYIRDKDNSVVLSGFDSIRYGLRDRYDVTFSTDPYNTSSGYEPIEIYTHDNDRIGSWTDIYSAGGLLYSVITGIVPPLRSIHRLSSIINGNPDRLQPALKLCRKGYTKNLLKGIDWAMNILEKDRPQTVAEWREQLLSSGSGGKWYKKLFQAQS